MILLLRERRSDGGVVQRLNYNHLMYFWRVAREGGLAPAGKLLRLSPQTLSGQIHAFEDVVGHKLFERRGRRLELTDVGRIAFQYADEVFALGQELSDVFERGVLDRPQRLDVGLVDGFPKMVASRILGPLTRGQRPVVVSCKEGTLADLAPRLASHTLDVVLADEPLSAGASIRAFNHLLGETGVTFFAAPDVPLKRLRFPDSLDGARFLLPFAGSPLRRQLEVFFAKNGITPHVVGEIEDSGLLKAFGRSALGVFCAPSLVAQEISQMYRVRELGSTDEVVERFYAISVERRVKHAAVNAMLEMSRAQIFR